MSSIRKAPAHIVRPFPPGLAQRDDSDVMAVGSRRSVDAAKRAEALRAGEVVVNAIDRDGVMEGYDLELITEVRKAISLPMTVLGGAGTLKDIADHRVYCARRALRLCR